jgi:type I restriction enzyme, S subunit
MSKFKEKMSEPAYPAGKPGFTGLNDSSDLVTEESNKSVKHKNHSLLSGQTGLDNVWKEYKLRNIGCSFLSGYGFKSSDYTSFGIPLIKIGNIQNRIVRVDPNGDFISDESIDKKISHFVLKNNDVLIAMTGQGSVGRVGRLKLNNEKQPLLNQRVGKFICDEVNLNLDFLYYVLSSDKYQDYLFNTGSGSGQPNLSPELILETEVPFPSYSEQRAIASILSSLDDKIDLLHRQNKTLEALAKTLFRQWFVEEADESWEVGTLEDEFDFVMGQSPLGAFLNENKEGLIFYQGRTDFDFRFPKPRIYTTTATRIAKKFDTLVSVRAPVGDMNMAIEECCLGRGVAAFRYKHNNAFYSYTYYKMRSLMTQIKQFEDSGTVFGSIGKDDFKKFENIIPPRKLVEEFQGKVKDIDDKIYSNTIQIRTLSQLRDTLLPKLMSGEVRVGV